MAEDEKRAWKDQYMLRLPDGMRDSLKRIAAENGRSLNAEIVIRLQSSLDEEGVSDNEDDDRLFLLLPEELVEKIAVAAERMNRTVGAQALDTLEKSYLPPKG